MNLNYLLIGFSCFRHFAWNNLPKAVLGILCIAIISGCTPDDVVEQSRPGDTPTGFIEVPFGGECETETSWVQANVKVITLKGEPISAVEAQITLYLNGQIIKRQTAYTPVELTTADDRVTVDFEMCGSTLPVVEIDIRDTDAIYPPPQSLLLVNKQGVRSSLRPIPIEDIDEDDNFITGDKNSNPGYLVSSEGGLLSSPAVANNGHFNGKNYLSRYFLTTVVSPPHDKELAVDLPRSCNEYDTDFDGAKELLGQGTYAALWRGNAPDEQRSAVVMFEGIDGNNETYPAQWWGTLNKLNPSFQKWEPQSGNWGADIWAVDYQWGGTGVRQCLIPAAKKILEEIGEYYKATEGRPIPITVVGFSMGGVVARGALAQIDASAPREVLRDGRVIFEGALADLGIRALVTFDSPHNGAEIHFKTGVFLAQIHWGPFFEPMRNHITERPWLKLWNPASNELLYEMCGNYGGGGVKNIENEGDFKNDLLECRGGSRTTIGHDEFFIWLRNQGLPNSEGYPTSIPMYAISLALGRDPDPNKDSYLVGNSTLWKISIPQRPDNVVFTPVGDTTFREQANWRGRRNRKPGSRVSMRAISHEGTGYTFYGINNRFPFLNIDYDPTLQVNYDPTFISLTSAFDSPADRNDCCWSSYDGSPFDRVWYPIERPSCPPSTSDGMDCDGGSWYHDVEDILANKHAMGIDDRVGEGQDLAYGFDDEGTDWKHSTLIEFISMATNPGID